MIDIATSSPPSFTHKRTAVRDKFVDELKRGWRFSFADRTRMHAGGLVNDAHLFFPRRPRAGRECGEKNDHRRPHAYRSGKFDFQVAKQVPYPFRPIPAIPSSLINKFIPDSSAHKRESILKLNQLTLYGFTLSTEGKGMIRSSEACLHSHRLKWRVRCPAPN